MNPPGAAPHGRRRAVRVSGDVSGTSAPDAYRAPGSLLGRTPLIELPGRRLPLPWQGWSARHGVAMTVLVPVAYLAMRAANPSPTRDGIGWVIATAVLAGVAALVLATYVPRRSPGASSPRPAGPAAASPTPCAAMAGGSVFVAMFLLGATPGPLGAVGALAVLAFGLYQRTSGTCGL